MIRVERIEHKKAEIIESINFVSKNLPLSFEDFESSKILMNALYKQIEFAIQNVMDICSIINSDLDLGFPENDDSILDHLDKNKIVLSTEFPLPFLDPLKDQVRYYLEYRRHSPINLGISN